LKKNPNLKIRIIAKGYSDGLGVVQGTKYDGKLGNDITITYYDIAKNNTEGTTQFIIHKTPMDNLGYAKLRAYDIIKYLQRRFPIDDDNIAIYVKEYKQIGKEYRGCDFSIVLEDVLLLRDVERQGLKWRARQFIPHN